MHTYVQFAWLRTHYKMPAIIMMMIIYCGTTVGCLSQERTPCAPIGNFVVSDSIWVMRTMHTIYSLCVVPPSQNITVSLVVVV